MLVGTLGAPAHASYQLLSLRGAEGVARAVGKLLQSGRLRGASRFVLERVMGNIYAPDSLHAEDVEIELARLRAHPEILVSMVQVALGASSQKLLQQADQIRCPHTLCAWRRGRAGAPRYARAIHDRIAQAGGSTRFETLPGAGHMLLQQRASELATLVLQARLGMGAAPQRAQPR